MLIRHGRRSRLTSKNFAASTCIIRWMIWERIAACAQRLHGQSPLLQHRVQASSVSRFRLPRRFGSAPTIPALVPPAFWEPRGQLLRAWSWWWSRVLSIARWQERFQIGDICTKSEKPIIVSLNWWSLLRFEEGDAERTIGRDRKSSRSAMSFVGVFYLLRASGGDSSADGCGDRDRLCRDQGFLGTDDLPLFPTKEAVACRALTESSRDRLAILMASLPRRDHAGWRCQGSD